MAYDGLTLPPRFTVPENPPTLERLMTDWPLIPGFTQRVVGVASMVKSEFAALTTDTDTINDANTKNEAHVARDALMSRWFREPEKLIFLWAVMSGKTQLSLSIYVDQITYL